MNELLSSLYANPAFWLLLTLAIFILGQKIFFAATAQAPDLSSNHPKNAKAKTQRNRPAGKKPHQQFGNI